MNCKPGDLAIVIYSKCGNEGKIVEVISWIGKVPTYVGNDVWLVKSNGSNIFDQLGRAINHLQDSHLRPVSGIPDTEDTDIEQPIKEVA